MSRFKRIMKLAVLAVLILSALCVPALALDESEVEAAVAASSKEAVTGNVLIWFLCAVAFLKVSQKIDSFMASLGVNVGRTGGSMLADAMVTFRAVTMATGGAGRILGGGRRGSGASASGGASGGSSSSAGLAGFFKGGLIDMAGRHITNSAVKTATTQTSAVHTAQKQGVAAVHTASERMSASEAHTDSTVHSGGIVHTDAVSHTDSTARSDSAIQQEGIILTGNDTPPAAPIQTGGGAPPAGNAVPVGPAPVDSGISSGPPPQENGIILTGTDIPPVTSAPADMVTPADNISAPDVGIPPTPAVPQEETVLAGGEVQSSSVIQTEGQTDSVLRQDGVIQTGGEQVVHSSSEKAHSETDRQGGGGDSISESHTVNHTRSVENVHRSTHNMFPVRMPTLGGAVFSHSLQSGGQFANDVIGMVARGDMRSTGSITGDLAAQSLQSYMGHTALGASAAEKVSFSQVEIGGGRITGREVTPEHPQGIEFAMYHVDQYSRPEGDYQKVFSADGAAWYKQHAVDTVVKTPFKAPDGEIDYQKEIVKRLPTPPKRKDRM